MRQQCTLICWKIVPISNRGIRCEMMDFFNLDAVTQRLQLMEYKAASGEALHVLMRDSDEHRG